MNDDFISEELEYFAPILARQRKVTNTQLANWRQESISERRKRISDEVFELCEGCVREGPFAGLRLTGDNWWGGLDLGAQCLGVYESSILDFIGGNENKPWDTFVCLGAADGYYPVGMLLTNRANRAICFESSPRGRKVIENNWRLNGSPGLLEVRGPADERSIADIEIDSSERNLVLIDIEGDEFNVLTEAVIGQLSSCEIIIEIHNWQEDFIEKYTGLLTVVGDFFEIHRLPEVSKQIDTRLLRHLSDDSRYLLLSEGRPCLMRFLYLKPYTYE